MNDLGIRYLEDEEGADGWAYHCSLQEYLGLRNTIEGRNELYLGSAFVIR